MRQSWPISGHCLGIHLEMMMMMSIIISFFFLHALGRLTCSGIDALPSFPGASTISSSSRFAVEGVSWWGGLLASMTLQLCRRELTFLVGPPMSNSPQLERSQTKRDKLVLQEWGFSGWAGNPPKKNENIQKQRRTALEMDGSNVLVILMKFFL